MFDYMKAREQWNAQKWAEVDTLDNNRKIPKAKEKVEVVR